MEIFKFQCDQGHSLTMDNTSTKYPACQFCIEDWVNDKKNRGDLETIMAQNKVDEAEAKKRARLALLKNSGIPRMGILRNYFRCDWCKQETEFPDGWSRFAMSSDAYIRKLDLAGNLAGGWDPSTFAHYHVHFCHIVCRGKWLFKEFVTSIGIPPGLILAGDQMVAEPVTEVK